MQIKEKVESIEKETFGDVSAWSRKRELRQRKMMEDLWAGKGRKPTPSSEVCWAWDLGINKIFSFPDPEQKRAQKNLAKEILR